MAVTVTITEHTTTATKYAGACIQMWDAKSSTFAGNQEQVRCEWRITSAPAGWSYKTVTDPRDGAQSSGAISIEDWNEGWVAAIFPDAAGDYTVEFRVTEFDGTQGTATDTVTIAAQSGFTTINCTAPGDLQTALSTVVSGGGSNYIINLAGDVTYDITARTQDVFTNVVIQWDNTGSAKPIIDLASNVDIGFFVADDGCENFILKGVSWLDSSNANTDNADQSMFNLAGATTTPLKDLGLIDCECDATYSMGNAFTANTADANMLLWDCDFQSAKNYSGTLIDTDVVAIGGYCGPVLVERPWRTSGGALTLIGHRAATPHKDAVRISGSSDFDTIYRCKLEILDAVTVDAITTQPSNAIMCGLNSGTPGSLRVVRSQLLVSSTDARSMAAYIENTLGTAVTARGTLISGCVCEQVSDNNLAACVSSISAGQRMTVLNSTVIGHSDTSNTSILGGFASDVVIVEGCNLMYDGGTPASAFNDRLVKLGNPTTLSFVDNVIDVGTNVNTTAYTFNSTNYNFANFEAASADINSNAEATVTLDANYLPASTTAENIPTGSFVDYYGNVLTPGNAGIVGATQSLPPASSGVPINANLDKITLPTAASSSLVKVMSVHDSQGLVNQNRLGGGVQKWEVPFVGRLFGFESQSYCGIHHADETDANATRTRIDWATDSWSNANATIQQGWGNQIAFSADVANFYDMFKAGFTAGNYFNGYDLDARFRAGMLVYDASDSPNRMNLVEFRGATFGIGERFGQAGDTDMNGNDVVFSGAGAIHICDMEIRAAGSLGSPGNSPVGLRAEAVTSIETGDSHKFVAMFMHESPSGKTFPTSGLFFGDTGDGGLSAYDHTQQAQAVKNAMVEAVGGYDVVMIMLGHNNDATGTYKSNVETLITQWTLAHTGGGYAVPSFLLVAPWQSDGAGSWTASKVQDLYDVAIAGNHGFISLWDSYGADSPEPRTERLDGTAADYTMDGNDLHPNDTTTAEAISMDLWWHFQEANWVTDTGGPLPVRGDWGIFPFNVSMGTQGPTSRSPSST